MELAALGQALQREEVSLANDPWLRLAILERILELERDSAGSETGYHYWQLSPAGSWSPLAAALAETYLHTGQLELAHFWAHYGNRPDLEARALVNIGNRYAALTVIEGSDWSFSKARGRAYASLLLSELGAEATLTSARKRYPSLTERLLAKFGSWETLTYEISTGEHEELSPFAVPPRRTVSSDEIAHLIKIGRRSAAEVESWRSEVDECRNLAQVGRLEEAEQQARAILKGVNPDRFALDRLVTEICIAQSRVEEALARFGPGYLSRDRDLYFNFKLVMGLEITARDVVANFFYLIERRSALFDKVGHAYVEEAQPALAQFVSSEGKDPFRLLASFSRGRDRSYTWKYHGFQFIKEGLDEAFWQRFGTWFHFCGNERLEQDWLSPILGDLETRVARRFGTVARDERWKSERALFTAVCEILGRRAVKRHASPKWLSPQHLDVFIPDLGLAIEYMGEQHFRPLEFFGGEEGFRQTIARDRRKEMLCELNHIRLMTVSFNESWDEVLSLVRTAGRERGLI